MHEWKSSIFIKVLGKNILMKTKKKQNITDWCLFFIRSGAIMYILEKYNLLLGKKNMKKVKKKKY